MAERDGNGPRGQGRQRSARPAHPDRSGRSGASCRPRSDGTGRPLPAGRPRPAPGQTGRAGRPERGGRTQSAGAGRETRGPEPALPAHVDAALLDRSVRAQLRTLSKANAEIVAAHLVAAGLALDSDPRRALEHARAARSRASRIAAVREAVGIAAYRAQEWAEAITELRTARRISGDPSTLPVVADCERALGRPEQAARALSDPDVKRLDPQTRAELLIVVAGARRDLGQWDAALAVLARGGLDRERPRPGALRLWYAYADTLAECGRGEEAAQWFAAAAALDTEGETDAVDRAAALL